VDVARAQPGAAQADGPARGVDLHRLDPARPRIRLGAAVGLVAEVGVAGNPEVGRPEDGRVGQRFGEGEPEAFGQRSMTVAAVLRTSGSTTASGRLP
jgi:hypothetical protein